MDLNRLVKDLEEIKGYVEDNQIEKAEDLLGFVIGEISIAAQQSVQSDVAYCTCSTVIIRDGVHCVNCGLPYNSQRR